MKTRLVFCLTIVAMMLFSGAIYVNAAEVSTEIFSPLSYVEFCSLKSPIDYTYDEATDTHIICEKDRIVMFKNQLFSQIDMTGYNISQIKFLGSNHLLFLSEDSLYCYSLLTQTVSDTTYNGICFDVLNNTVVLSVGNSFSVLTADTSGDTAVFNQTSTYETRIRYEAVAMVTASSWLCINEGTLYRFDSSGNGTFSAIADNLKNPRHACYYDGHYYLTKDDGIYSVRISDGNTVFLRASTDSDLYSLGNVYAAYGISCHGGYLYITDTTLGAVSQFDPIKMEFTGFYITARSEGAGRVSADANDIKTDGEVIYSLDKNTLKIFDNKTSIYKPLPVGGTFTSFYVIGNRMLASTGSAMYAFESTDLSGEDFISRVNIGADMAAFTSITAITGYGDKFYFLNNTTINSVQYAEIYEITSDFSVLTKVAQIQGTGYDLCTDIYGKMYVQIDTPAKKSVMAFNVYDTVINELYATSDDAEKINAITCDFESNVYALLNGNKIARIENGLTTVYTLKLSPNLPEVSAAKDLVIIPATDKMYALFNGFILEVSGSDLSIASPEKIKVPDSYPGGFNGSPYATNLNLNTRYFEVDLNNTGEYFDYTGYSTYTGDQQFVILTSDEKYTLIANESLSCIVRTNDISTYLMEKTAESKTMYLAEDGYIYRCPIATECFRLSGIEKDSQVTLTQTLTFNGEQFAVISFGDSEGFIPLSMLKSGVAVTDTPLYYMTLSAGINGATVYGDENLTTVIGQVSAYETVKIAEELDNVYKIQYGNGFGYVEKSAVSPKGLIVIRNFVLVSLPIIAIIVTVCFVYRRKYKKPEQL